MDGAEIATGGSKPKWLVQIWHLPRTTCRSATSERYASSCLLHINIKIPSDGKSIHLKLLREPMVKPNKTN